MNKELMNVLACILIGYILGSLSPAFLVGKLKGVDVRKEGSKNAGASNTVLLVGKIAGFIVAALDILKATASWHIAAALFPALVYAGPLGGASCILGHMYPLALRFKGGKGLACLGGVILAFSPRSFLLMLCAALVLGLVTNYVCIVTTSMAFIFPAYYYYMTGSLLCTAILAIPAIPMLFKHFENFRRIKEGKEFHLSFLWDRKGELLRTGHEDEDI